MATIGRSATQGSSSGRFYQPIDVQPREDGRIVIYPQGETAAEGFSFWPDEAEQLALAVLKLVYRAN